MIDLAISPAYFKNTPFSQLRYRLFDAVWLADCVDWEEQRAEERARAGVLETDIIDLAPGAYTKIFSTACFHWYVCFSSLSPADLFRLFFSSPEK